VLAGLFGYCGFISRIDTNASPWPLPDRGGKAGILAAWIDRRACLIRHHEKDA